MTCIFENQNLNYNIPICKMKMVFYTNKQKAALKKNTNRHTTFKVAKSPDLKIPIRILYLWRILASDEDTKNGIVFFCS